MAKVPGLPGCTGDDRSRNEIEYLPLGRQKWVIMQARKDIRRRYGISIKLPFPQEMNLKRELKSQNDFTQLTALNKWKDKAREDLEDLKSVLKSLNATLQTKEKRTHRDKADYRSDIDPKG